MIPYGRQEITQADSDAVVALLSTDFLPQGREAINLNMHPTMTSVPEDKIIATLTKARQA